MFEIMKITKKRRNLPAKTIATEYDLGKINKVRDFLWNCTLQIIVLNVYLFDTGI